MAEDRQLNIGKFNSNMQDQNERKNNGHVRGGGKGSGGGKSQVIYRPGSGPLKKTGEADNISESSGLKSGPKGPSSRQGSTNWRSKPSQQLYQPPGNSRESTPGPPEINPERDLSSRMAGLSTSGDNDSSDEKRRSKKPDQTIYIPRPKAQAMAENVDEPWEAQGAGKGRGGKKMSGSNSWEQEMGRKGKSDSWDRPRRDEVPEWRKPSNKEQGRRGKGFGKRGQADDTSWRSQSPLQRSESMSGLSPARDSRQNSEPRSLPFDSRGPPSRGSEPPMKPPMGPRGGRGSKPNLQSLPPRFQKMHQASNDEWDGNKSLVFQGHSHTLPHPPRGSQPAPRGERDRRMDDSRNQSRNARSATPDQFKRPKTPPQHSSGTGRGRRPSPSGRKTPNQDWGGRKSPFALRRTPSQESVGRRRGKNRNRYHSGGSSMEENGGYRDRRHSDPRVTPQPTASNKVIEDKGSEDEPEQLLPISVPEITDWSAEVEESDRLEAEALASETESNAAKSEHHQRKKKKSRHRKRKGDDKGKEKADKLPASVEKSQTPHKGGLLILPPNVDMNQSQPSQLVQRALYDPNNPSKPIMMKTGGMRMPQPQHPQYSSPPEMGMHNRMAQQSQPYPQAGPFVPAAFPRQATVQSGLDSAKPAWYDRASESFRNCRIPHLLFDLERADWELKRTIMTHGVLNGWPNICQIRQFLLNSLTILLVQDIKFSQVENIEQHIWKLTFHHVIELLRNGQAEEINQEVKEIYKKSLLFVVEDGLKYFDNLLGVLQENYKFSVEELTCEGAAMNSPKGNAFSNLAILSAQKICLFMGDLARYKEQANETSNYNKAKQWYTKAQMLNPKNGRPYNQLAILALHARRKLDAVYFYMRSMIASNPFHTARESLLSIFDENRKKFEAHEKKRREEQAAEERERLQEKEAMIKGHRKEIWVHPDNSSKEWQMPADSDRSSDWREEELSKMSFTELNKQFLTSYLHVQGKLFTRIGMESFQEAAHQMLREFRALLQHSPVPVSSTRFLQLLALNMFAIENTQLKGRDLEPGCRSAMQENALIVSLQMFNLILERCADLFPAPSSPVTKIQDLGDVSEDLQTLLPAIKVWCDWLLCHTAVWNPPPSCADYIVGPPGDAWTRLANLVNRLERLDLSALELSTTEREGYEIMKLPEDMALAGFTPLMFNAQELVYVPKNLDMELAYNCLRIKKVQFFGTEFLCGIDPPVLKLQRWDNERSLYISLVETSRSPGDTPPDRSPALSPAELRDLERNRNTMQNRETPANAIPTNASAETSSEIKNLLSRKEELTRTHQSQERHRQQAQAIVDQQALSGCVEMKVRPRLLVPDTNCFIDHLESLQQLFTVFSLMVPLVVLHELEGLSKGSRSPVPLGAPSEHTLHMKYVSERATGSLAFLKSRPHNVKCVTTKGTVLAPSGVAMVEDSGDQDMKNDDRILNTCLSLIKTSSRGDESNDPLRPGETRQIFRDVVLLTEDRNLRVKCLARDVPVRPIGDFLRWANIKQ